MHSKIKTMKAILALEDGRVFEGRAFGSVGESSGEVVFNTSMMGYQEILTDPSYNGQIVVMTYPLIGNYGLNQEDFESKGPCIKGFVVKEHSVYPSNWRSQYNLDEFLKRYKIVGIEDIDTRTLTLHLRNLGAKKGIISSVDLDKNRLVQRAKASPGLVGRDLVSDITTLTEFNWDRKAELKKGKVYKVIAYDFGIKYNILKKLSSYECEVTIVPAFTPAEEVIQRKPDGIFLSNGPGDPEGLSYAIKTVRRLIGLKPVFGICLGHQILALALGARTFKLKFGHHGANHPVKNLITGRIEITAQNHGFAVEESSMRGAGLVLTHINLNDHTVEGLKHEDYPLFSVQYHPEASPGPHDSDYLFERFIELMEKGSVNL
jgi:carbamoyl-phosphate synthase small subunit